MAGSTLPEAVRAGYTAALDAVLGAVPEPARASRAANLDSFLTAGFPHKALEDWRYTDLSTLSRTPFPLASSHKPPEVEAYVMPGTWRLVFVNGCFSAASSDFPAGVISRRADRSTPVDESEKDSISQLNAALALDGAELRLPRGQTLDRPLHVLSFTTPGDKPAMSHLSHAVSLEAGTAATVIFEDVTLGDGEHFLTQRVGLKAMDNSRLDVIRLQDHGAGVSALTRWDASVERDARLNWMNLDLGGALVRNDLCVNLAAPNASLDLAGVFVGNGSTHIDNHTRIDHRRPHGSSRQDYRGIVGDRAHAVFNGKVIVHPDAIKTDSNLQTASLLLSPHAQVNAKPELQIDNDDVKCAHGATCGQLDTNALYYLRSRGLSMTAAREVLLYGFANALVRQVEHEATRNLLRRRLISRFPAGAVVEDLS